MKGSWRFVYNLAKICPFKLSKKFLNKFFNPLQCVQALIIANYFKFLRFSPYCHTFVGKGGKGPSLDNLFGASAVCPPMERTNPAS